MQLVDSKQQMLQSGEIITIDATNTKGQQVPVEIAKATFTKIMAQQGAQALRYGNTIFVSMVSPKNPSIAVVVVANADTAPNVPINIMRMLADLQKDGITTVSMKPTEPETIAALQQLSQKYAMKWSRLEDGTPTVEITLGAAQRPGLALGA